MSVTNRKAPATVTPDGDILLGPHSPLIGTVSPTDWINQVLHRLWPHLRRYLEKTIIDTVQPIIVASLPSALSSFNILRVDLGEQPPFLEALDAAHTGNEIQLRGQISLRAVTTIDVSLMKIHFGVSQIHFDGDIACRFLPLLDTIPFFGALQFLFVKNPRLDIKYSGVAKVAGFPILEKTIHDIIIQQINLALVAPNCITVKMLNDVVDAQGYITRNIFHEVQMKNCQGVCKIQVLRGIKLEDHDKVSVHRHDKSDPYVKLQVGKQQYVTQVVKDSLNPQWIDQHFDILISSTELDVKIECYDKDDGSTDDLIGIGAVKLKDLILQKECQVSLLEDDKNTGSIVLAATHYDLIDASVQQIKDDKLGAVLVIGVECAKGLKETYKGKQVHPRVELLLDLERRSTFPILPPANEYIPVPDFKNPRWDQSFPFRLEKVPTEISFFLYVSEGDFIASFKIPFQRVLDANGDFQDWIDLNCDWQGAQLKVHAKLYGLKESDGQSPERMVLQQMHDKTKKESHATDADRQHNWLNDIIAGMWPHIAAYTKEIMNTTVEPMMQDSLPKQFKGLSFTQVELGNVPPTIDDLSVTLAHRSMELILDLSFLSKSAVELSLTEKIKAGVNNIQLRARLSVIMQPIYSQPPFCTGLQIVLLDRPGLFIDFTNIADIADWSYFRQAIKDLIETNIAAYLVAPHRLLIQIPGLEENFENHYVAPLGILRLTYISCTAEGNFDVGSLPDIYSLTTVGAETKRTSTINRGFRNKAPLEWPEGEVHEFICCSMDQTVFFECWDEDVGNMDELAGRTSIGIQQLLSKKEGTCLEFFGDLHVGSITVKGEMFEIDKSNIINGCSVDHPIISTSFGVITVLLDRLINIPDHIDPSTVFKFDIFVKDRDEPSNVIGEFKSIGITSKFPKWNETSYIRYDNINPNSLYAHGSLSVKGKVIMDWKSNLLQATGNVLKDRDGMKSLLVQEGEYTGMEVVLGFRVCGTLKDID